MNPDDENRDHILRFLYERHKTARGVSAIPLGIRDLQRDLKERHGMSQQDVAHNLDYLLQVGWVREVSKEREFTTGGGMKLSREQVKYKISDVGLDHLEAASAFKKPATGSHLDITNIKGVTIVGDGNVANLELTDLSRALTELEEALLSSEDLEDAAKLDALADLATLRDQASKKAPDKTIMERAWTSLQLAANVATLVDLIAKIGQLVSQYVT